MVHQTDRGRGANRSEGCLLISRPSPSGGVWLKAGKAYAGDEEKLNEGVVEGKNPFKFAGSGAGVLRYVSPTPQSTRDGGGALNPSLCPSRRCSQRVSTS